MADKATLAVLQAHDPTHGLINAFGVDPDTLVLAVKDAKDAPDFGGKCVAGVTKGGLQPWASAFVGRYQGKVAQELPVLKEQLAGKP